MTIDLVNMALDLVWPPAALMLLAAIYPAVLFVRFWTWVYNYLFPENIHNKVVIITGASSGIGEHTAYEYAKGGAKLVLCARRENLLRDVAERARRYGALDVRIIRADVGKQEDCKRVIDETVNHYGTLDHLVNNAGCALASLFWEAKTEAFHSCFDRLFWGNVYCTYYALPHLKRSRGRIVVNASACAFSPLPRLNIYNAAKAAKVQLYETLRVELGSQVGITVVCPGWIESQMTQGRFIGSDGSERFQDPSIRDTVVGPTPIAYTEVCAKAIFSGAVRRKRFVVVPYWYQAIIYFRLVAPELLDSWFRFFFVVPVTKDRKPPSKVILDVTGAKRILYPQSCIRPPHALGKAE